MSRFDLSPEQKAIVHADEPYQIVSAAAGSGKTRVLSERYLRLVRERGIRPDQILTITFTRKAAAEMKERIVHRLREADLLAEAQAAETGPIQTIHSFCERVLRENALEAGLDPLFKVAADARFAREKRMILQEAIADGIEQSEEAAELAVRLVGVGRTFRPDAYALPRDHVERALDRLRTSGILRTEFAERHRDVATVLENWHKATLETLMPEERACFEDMTEGDFSTRVRQAIRQAAVRTGKNGGLPAGYGRANADEEAAARDTVGLARMIEIAWGRLERLMDQKQELDFPALEARAIELLESSTAVQARIARQFRAVLVDEAQDMNPLQHRLVACLRPETAMLVGDHQQSIFGFRHADVAIFQNLCATPEHRRLAKNYRSAPGILNFVDHVFGGWWSQGYVPMGEPVDLDLDAPAEPDFRGVELWNMPRDNAYQTATWVREILDEGYQPRDIAILLRAARDHARRYEKALAEAGIDAQIVGGSEAFFTRLEVHDLANALRALADPHDDFALLALLRGPAVGISLDAWARLAFAKPVFPCLAEYAGQPNPDGERITAFLRWFPRLSEIADRLSAWEVIAEFFACSPYLERIAQGYGRRQSLMNARKLLALAANDPDLGPREFADQVRDIQRLQHREGDAPILDQDAQAVTIMTIHKAKGLEWPVVIVPSLHSKMRKASQDPAIDPRRGLLATAFQGAHLFHALTAQEVHSREQQEEQRVLYVALTRARERLCVAVDSLGEEESAARELWKSAVSRATFRHPSTLRIRYHPERESGRA